MCIFLFKFITNFIFVIVFFILLESLLYYKDYSEVKIISEYIKYEIENNDISSFSSENYKVIVKEDKSYDIIFYRNSMFAFSRYKIIKYDGIVSESKL